jgi:hypothetical protein
VKYVNIHIFSHLTWLSQKKTVGDREKLLTYLNSALKIPSVLDIFSRGTKKKLNFVDQCYRTSWLFKQKSAHGIGCCLALSELRVSECMHTYMKEQMNNCRRVSNSVEQNPV